jgi:hypothetical protein
MLVCLSCGGHIALRNHWLIYMLFFGLNQQFYLSAPARIIHELVSRDRELSGLGMRILWHMYLLQFHAEFLL